MDRIRITMDEHDYNRMRDALGSKWEWEHVVKIERLIPRSDPPDWEREVSRRIAEALAAAQQSPRARAPSPAQVDAAGSLAPNAPLTSPPAGDGSET